MDKSKKTVFITGTSSGIGLQTAIYFYERGWNVIASMRNPEKRRTLLHDKGLPDLLHLDVLDESSIQSAVDYAQEKYGGIDVLVNNAGYAVYGPFETISADKVKRQFETNLFGLMAVTRAVLPIFRRQQNGVLINVSSIGGRSGFPLYSIYNSTKWGVEGFTEALQYELRPFNIKVKLIEPGVIRTDFYGRSMDQAQKDTLLDVYAGVIKRNQDYVGENADRSGLEPQTVAKTIFRAAQDSSWRVRYPVGMDGRMVLFLRWLLPENILFRLLNRVLLN